MAGLNCARNSGYQRRKTAVGKRALGHVCSAHPLDVYRKVLSTLRTVKSLSLDELGKNVVMGGIISRLKKTLTAKTTPWLFLRWKI